jgi:hypothetical protein
MEHQAEFREGILLGYAAPMKLGAIAARRSEPGVCAVPLSNSAGLTIRIFELTSIMLVDFLPALRTIELRHMGGRSRQIS